MYKIQLKTDKILFTFYEMCAIMVTPYIRPNIMNKIEQQEVVSW